MTNDKTTKSLVFSHRPLVDVMLVENYLNREKIEKLSTPYKGVIVSFHFYTDEINLTLEEFQRGYLWYNEDDDELLY